LADWDKRYREAEAPLFGEAPSEYVRMVMARSDVEIRSALLLGDGDGRNGGWLAKQGVAITAVDISDVATELALRNDAERGVRAERVAADIGQWQPAADARWDAIFMIYLQCDAATRNGAVARLARHIAPGGWFVAEGFAAGGNVKGDLGPMVDDLLYRRDDLIAALPGFRTVEAMEGLTYLDEGARHQGTAWVLRLLMRQAPA
jgi:SAM-dependent methyltransferase